MGTAERRQELLEVLCVRRFDTYDNLAREFGVSRETIRHDVLYLMQSHPLEIVRGRYGGVKVKEGYYLYHDSLTIKEAGLLKRVMDQLVGEDRNTIKSILRRFAPWYLSPAP